MSSPLILNLQEVSNFLGLGLSQACEIVKCIAFPAFKAGSRTSQFVYSYTRIRKFYAVRNKASCYCKPEA